MNTPPPTTARVNRVTRPRTTRPRRPPLLEIPVFNMSVGVKNNFHNRINKVTNINQARNLLREVTHYIGNNPNNRDYVNIAKNIKTVLLRIRQERARVEPIRNVAMKWMNSPKRHVINKRTNVVLPSGAYDPITYNNFKVGNEAYLVSRKWKNTDGRMRTTRYFISGKTLKKMTNMTKNMNIPLRKIVQAQMHVGLFPDPETRRTIFRRNILPVKFI